MLLLGHSNVVCRSEDWLRMFHVIPNLDHLSPLACSAHVKHNYIMFLSVRVLIPACIKNNVNCDQSYRRYCKWYLANKDFCSSLGLTKISVMKRGYWFTLRFIMTPFTYVVAVTKCYIRRSNLYKQWISFMAFQLINDGPHGWKIKDEECSTYSRLHVLLLPNSKGLSQHLFYSYAQCREPISWNRNTKLLARSVRRCLYQRVCRLCNYIQPHSYVWYFAWAVLNI